MLARRCVALGVLISSTSGCDLPPIRYETEHLLVGIDIDAPLCGGSLRELDQQVLLVEEALDYQVDGQLELYIFENGPGSICNYSEPGGGCYDPGKQRAYAYFGAAKHELIHAATDQIGVGDALFTEGLAADLTGLGLRFPTSSPASNLGLDFTDVSLRTAGHFSRWLRSKYSAREIRDLLKYSSSNRGPDHTHAAFEKATGDSFLTVEEDYYETAPEFFAAFDVLVPPTVSPVGDGWDLMVDFDCEQDDTEGFGGKMWRRLILDVVSPGPYVLEVSPPASAIVTLRRTEDWPVSAEFPNEPIPPVGDDWLVFGEPIASGAPSDIQLDTARYEIEIRVPNVDATTVNLRVQPKVGAVPGVPQ